MRQRLAQAWIEVRILGLNNERKLATLMDSSITPGPEASFAKLYWASMHKRMSALAIDVIGADGMLFEAPIEEEREMVRHFLTSRAETIYGGTNQIQRNTIGERVLGLPKEPR